MTRLDLIQTLLVITIISASIFPVYAPINDPDVTVEPQIINVNAGRVFEVGIWIRNLPAPMSILDIAIVFDGTMMELVNVQRHEHFGWEQSFSSWDEDQYSGSAFGVVELNLYWETDHVTEDLKWVTLTFRCLQEGTSTIDVESTITVQPNGSQFEIEADDFDGTVNQFAIVGGYAMPVHKIEILAPYLALTGLILAVSTIYVIKRRKV